MPLSASTLKSALQNIQKTQPTSIAQAAQVWAQAMFSYGSTGLATPCLPTLVAASLQATFMTSMQGATFMADLGKNLATWWQSAVWAGPAATGVTTTVPPFDTKSLGDQIVKGQVSDVAGFLSDKIDAWTKTIQVTVTTTTTPPVVTVVPVT
jgi:hypothetical protein